MNKTEKNIVKELRTLREVMTENLLSEYEGKSESVNLTGSTIYNKDQKRNETVYTAVIPTDILVLPDFQREIKTVESKFWNIVDEFSVEKAGAIKVVKYDGLFYLVDGHHRTEAAIKNGYKGMLAYVTVTDKDPNSVAALEFARQRENEKPLTPYETMFAIHTAYKYLTDEDKDAYVEANETVYKLCEASDRTFKSITGLKALVESETKVPGTAAFIFDTLHKGEMSDKYAFEDMTVRALALLFEKKSKTQAFNKHVGKLIDFYKKTGCEAVRKSAIGSTSEKRAAMKALVFEKAGYTFNSKKILEMKGLKPTKTVA